MGYGPCTTDSLISQSRRWSAGGFRTCYLCRNYPASHCLYEIHPSISLMTLYIRLGVNCETLNYLYTNSVSKLRTRKLIQYTCAALTFRMHLGSNSSSLTSSSPGTAIGLSSGVKNGSGAPVQIRAASSSTSIDGR